MRFRDYVTIDKLDVIGDVLIMGSFSILGSASTINTTNLLVSDTVFVLAHGQTGSPALDAGFFVDRGAGATQAFIWDESADEFAMIQTSDNHESIGNVNISSYANLRLGNIGIGGAPSANTTAYIKGSDTSSGTYSLRVDNSIGESMLRVRNDSTVFIAENQTSHSKSSLTLGGDNVANSVGVLQLSVQTNHTKIHGNGVQTTFETAAGKFAFADNASYVSSSFKYNGIHMEIPNAGNGYNGYFGTWINGNTSLDILSGGNTGVLNFGRENTGGKSIYMTMYYDGNIGMSTITPTARLHVLGATTSSASYALKVENSASANLLSVRNDGQLSVNANSAGITLQANDATTFIGSSGGSITKVQLQCNATSFILNDGRPFNLVGAAQGTSGELVSLHSYTIGSSAGSFNYGQVLYISDSNNGIRANTIIGQLIEKNPVSSVNNPSLIFSSLMMPDGGVTIGYSKTTNPTAQLQVKGVNATSSNYALKIDNSLSSPLLNVRNDGYVGIGIATASATLHVKGATSGATGSTIFKVDGNAGELFTINDSLTGSLFSVNDISGLPIMEAFSDSTIIMGDYSAPSLYTTKKVTVNTGTTDIYSIATASYTGAYYDYTISDGTNARSGTIAAVWLGPTIRYNETSTLDVGTTSNFTFSVVSSGTYSVLRTSASTSGWTVKTIIRSI